MQTDPVDVGEVGSKVKKSKTQKVQPPGSKSKKRREKSFTRTSPEVLRTGKADVITSREQLIQHEPSDENMGQKRNMVKQLVRSYNKLLWFAAELEEQLNVKVLNDADRIDEHITDESATDHAITHVNGSINSLLGAVAQTIKADKVKRHDVKLESKVSENLKAKYTEIVDDYKTIVGDYADAGPTATPPLSKTKQEPLKSRTLNRQKTDQAVKNFRNRAIGRTNSFVTAKGTLRSKSSVELAMDHLVAHSQTRPPNNSPTAEPDHHIPYQVHPEPISTINETTAHTSLKR